MKSFSEKQQNLQKFIQNHQSEVDWLGIRAMDSLSTVYGTENGEPLAPQKTWEHGYILEVLSNGQLSYAASSDFSEAGLKLSLSIAQNHAQRLATHKLHHFDTSVRPTQKGSYQSARDMHFDQLKVESVYKALLDCHTKMKINDRVVSTRANLRTLEVDQTYFSSNGSEIKQHFLITGFDVGCVGQKLLANGEKLSLSRSDNGLQARCYQIGAEVFQPAEWLKVSEETVNDLMTLLDSPNCPSDKRDLLLAPDQMMLQIHESIGHPLEYDRILGDERNYAGWSFVQPDDFGKLQYGSKILNVCFDPTHRGEMASYNFDDAGAKAEKQYLIKDGVLLRGLGALESQKRLGLPGVANSRAQSWNRAPIDRMANINIDPGTSSLEEMIAGTEKGILMKSNVSWSIDDYRRKFQFGCEYGQLIEDGRLTQVVRSPNYRGISIPFWNSLKKVGKESQAYGTFYCGKGEPNQIIRVGHASPYCLFENIDIFGAAQ